MELAQGSLREMTTIELSPAARQELERIVRAGPPNLARRARIVLARGDGASLTSIAAMVGLHRDSVRRWVIRFRDRGFPGLRHGNAGRPKNVVFDEGVRAEIRRRAGLDPQTLAEPFPSWSLYKLRSHLMSEGVVHSISVESLRLLLRAGEYSRTYWGHPHNLLGPLTAEMRAQLVEMAHRPPKERAQRARAVLAVADGETISGVASRMHMGKNSVRRWLQHFRLHGVAGLNEPSTSSRGLRSTGKDLSPAPESHESEHTAAHAQRSGS